MNSKRDWSSVIPEGLSDEWRTYVEWHLDAQASRAEKLKEDFNEEVQRSFINTLLRTQPVFPKEVQARLVGNLRELEEDINGKGSPFLNSPPRPEGPPFQNAPLPAA
jgi:hypothetical protein